MAEQAVKEEKVLNGSERSAILLMTLGEQDAATLLKHLNPKEVQRIGEAMASIGPISRKMVNDVLEAFLDAAGVHTSLGVGSEDYLRSILTEALGGDKAAGLIDRILLGRSSKGLETLKWMDPRAIAEVIRLEHPQIIAIVLSHLESDQAANVLSALPDKMRPDILMRIATLDGIQPSALHELDDILEQQFSGQSDNIKSSTIGGVKTAADLLNFLDTAIEGELIEYVKETDAELAEKIEDLMFVFANLGEIDDRSMQTLLREVESETLITALKGADEQVKEKVFRNMSKRAGEMLRDDLEAKGPVRLSDVEGAQKEILAIARRLSESGEISLGGAGEEYV